MSLELKMLTRDEFVPEHNGSYVAFTVDDFYGGVGFGYYQVEFHYDQVDAVDGYSTGSSCCYDDRDDIPFNVPLRIDDQDNLYVLTSEEIEFYKFHKDPNQRFWYIKDWFLHNGNHQIHSQELDEVSIGIMKEEDFMDQVVKANNVRKEIKYGKGNDH